MNKAVLLTPLVLALTGCAGQGLMNTNTPADAGNRPVDYEKSIHNHLKNVLKDYDSLKDLNIRRPLLRSCGVGIYGQFHAWRSTVSFNAKNSFGAYVGVKRYYYWFHGERLKGINQNPKFCPEAAGWLY